jgi:hypothetical protein
MKEELYTSKYNTYKVMWESEISGSHGVEYEV